MGNQTESFIVWSFQDCINSGDRALEKTSMQKAQATFLAMSCSSCLLG
jgi:hypothetical protein